LLYSPVERLFLKTQAAIYPNVALIPTTS
jgi:hypothetical protein